MTKITPYLLSTIGCLLFTVPLLAEEKPPGEKSRAPEEIKQTIEKWSYSHYDKDTLYWQAKGETATVNKKEFQINTIVITYYLGMEEGVSTPTDRFVLLKADEGYIKRDGNSAIFKNNVRLIMPNETNSKSRSLPDVTWGWFGMPSAQDDTWHLHANILHIKYRTGKKGKEILINSNQAVTLTQGSSLTITGSSLEAFSREDYLNSESQKLLTNKAIFNNALLVRSLSHSPVITSDNSAPARDGGYHTVLPNKHKETYLPRWTSRRRQVWIKADILELYDSPRDEEIIVLKGKKEVLLNYPSSENTGQGGENTKLTSASSHSLSLSCKGSVQTLWITSEGNALIYPRFHEIVFQKKVRAVQSEGYQIPACRSPGAGRSKENTSPAPVTDTNSTNLEISNTHNSPNPKGTLRSDILTIFLEPTNNEIKKVLAEGKVMLINHDGNLVSGEILEWLPAQHLLTIKSRNKVTVWSQNNLTVAQKVIIHTDENSSATLGNWKKIETSEGTIKIHPPEKKGKNNE